MSLSLPGGKTYIILQTLETINDLLDKRGALYSDRPETVMANELMGLGTVRSALLIPGPSPPDACHCHCRPLH